MDKKESFSTLWLSEESQQEVVRQHKGGASLVVYHRNGVLAFPVLGSEPIVVGRQPPADIVIDDPSLSRRHASFTRRDGVHQVHVSIPFTSRQEVGLFKKGDELVVEVGVFRRHIGLPTTLAALVPLRATFEDRTLVVELGEPR